MSRVYVAPISFGLGDLVVSLPADPGVDRDRAGTTATETWLVARSDAQARARRPHRRIGRLGATKRRSTGTITTVASSTSVIIHCNETGGGVRRSSRTPSDRSRSTTSSSRICADFGIAADFTRPVPLTACPRPEYRASVLLVTESDGPSKQWSVDCWKSLADAAPRARSLDVRLVTRDEAAPEIARARDRRRRARRRPATRSTCSALRPR